MSSDSPICRFQRSMNIDFEKWHDGIGYDLDALREASSEERSSIEHLLVNRRPLDWRDIESLALLDTPGARKALMEAMSEPNSEVQLAVIRFSPHLISREEQIAAVVLALRTAELFGGLSQALDQVAEFHPPEIISELFKGILTRNGDVAVLFAAMLVYIYEKADDPFDMKQRAFFLRFNTDVLAERRAAFRELCTIIGVDPNNYL
jgi:hypothetical protein